MEMEKIFRQTQKNLKRSLFGVLKKRGYNPIAQEGFIFAQGKHPVLLVAHLDTVHKTPVEHICYSRDGNIMMSPQGIGGDDRCGVYMILEIIKNIKCSVLFCEDEEIGMIGAQKFVKSNVTPKNINYIVEFDRKGSNDAVFYDCDNPDFTEFVTDAGFEEAFGSFSDISTLAPALGVAAVNISSGYYNAHTTHEYVDLSIVRNNIERVSELLLKDSDTFEYIEAKRFYTWCSAMSNLMCYDDSEYFIDLMPITSDKGYIIDSAGGMHDDGWFFIDKNRNVYCGDWDTGVAYEVDNCKAVTHSGCPIKFDEDFSEGMYIVPEEEFFLYYA